MIFRIIFLGLLSLALLSCHTFNEENFLHKSFGADLEKLSAGKESFYQDGLLEVNAVSKADLLYLAFFGLGHHFVISHDVVIDSEKKNYAATPESEIYYFVLGNFDGYVKVVLYIPKESKLVFVYSTAVM